MNMWIQDMELSGFGRFRVPGRVWYLSGAGFKGLGFLGFSAQGSTRV